MQLIEPLLRSELSCEITKEVDLLFCCLRAASRNWSDEDEEWSWYDVVVPNMPLMRLM